MKNALRTLSLFGFAFSLLFAAQAANYTILDSITTTGAQRILTGYTPSCTDRIEMKFSVANTSDTMCLWCARGTSTTTDSMTTFLVGGKLRCDRNANTASTGSAVSANTVYTIAADYNVCAATLNGSSYVSMAGTGTFTPGSELAFFASHYNGAANNLANYAKLTFYWCKVYDKDGNLLHAYFPAEDKSAAAGSVTRFGVYDTVAGEYKSTTLTTAFTGGATAASAYLTDDTYWDSTTQNLVNRFTFAAGEGGTVTATVDGEAVTSPCWVTNGAAVTVTATAEEGYSFKCWTGTGGNDQVNRELAFSAGQVLALTAEFIVPNVEVAPASCYVQNGLIAMYDALENDGARCHNADATEWFDLSGNNHHLTLPASGVSFGDSLVTLTKVKLSTTISELATAGDFTGEARVRADDTYNTLPYNISGSVRPVFDSTQCALIFRKVYNTDQKLVCGATYSSSDKKKDYCSPITTTPSSYDYICSDRTYAIVTTTSNRVARFGFDGISETSKATFWNPAGTLSSSFAVGNTDVPLYYRCVRLYNRQLSEAEVEWNALVDKIRFDALDGYRWNDEAACLECRVRITSDGGKFTVDGGGELSEIEFWAPVDATNLVLKAVGDGVAWSGALTCISSGSLTDDEITIHPTRAVDIQAVFGVGTHWKYDASAKTITHTQNNMTLSVTRSGDELTVTALNSYGDGTVVDLSVPAYDDEYRELPIVAISGNSVFYQKYDLTEVRLPDTLKNIGYRAFMNCTNLLLMTPCVPNSVTNIGDQAFYGCSKLEGRLNMHGCLKAGTQFANGSKLKFWDFGDPAVLTVLNNQASSPVTNVLPRILPQSCTTFPTLNGIGSLKQTLYIGPAVTTTTLSGDHARYSGWTEIDMTGSKVEKMGSWSFYGCSSCTQVTFSTTMQTFPNVNVTFGGCGAILRYRFRGDPFEVIGTNPFTGKSGYAYYLPKWNKNWEAALAENDYYKVSNMTSAECNYFVSSHPGESIPVEMLQVNAISATRPIKWWYPDPPPVYETVNLTDLLGYDGVAATATGENDDEADGLGAAKLFDGTTYSYYASHTGYRWFGEDGATAVLTIPESATKAREMKLTKYRLHQLCFNDFANARAPTQWKLEGKPAMSDSWVTIDEVTMTAESANTWAYLTNSTYTTVKAGTIPARAACSLTYDVPEAKQNVYHTFRFTPLNSYAKENETTSPYVYGLMELEFLGELTTPDPEIGSFAVAKSEWEDVRFTAVVSGLGEQPAFNRYASKAWAWIEVGRDETMSDLVSVGEPVEVAANEEKTLIGAGLAGASSYYARLVVSNDLEAVTKSDAIACATLDEPWICSTPVCSEDAQGHLVVTLGLSDLYTNGVELAFGYAANPAATAETYANRVVTAAGEYGEAASFAAPDTLGMGVVTITCGEIVRTYQGAASMWWMADDPTSPTKIVNTLNGVTFNVTVSGTNLTLKSIGDLAGVSDFDFSRPFWSSGAEKQFTLTSVGTAFAENLNLKSIILPDTMTAIPDNAFKNCTELKKVHLPIAIQSIGQWAFYTCSKLAEIEPFFPETCLTFGYGCFSNCKKLPQPVLPPTLTSIPGAMFSSSTGFYEITIPDTVTSIGDDAFSWTAITNMLPRFLPPQVTSFGKFEGTQIQGKLIVEATNWTTMRGDGFRYNYGITEADFSKSGLKSLSSGTVMYGCSKLRKITFPTCFESISPGTNDRNLCCPLRELVFLGAPPTAHASDFSSDYYIIFAPRFGPYGRAWDEYLAANPDWVKEMTVAEKALYRSRYPAERGPVCWLNLGGVTGWRYFRRFPNRAMMVILR